MGSQGGDPWDPMGGTLWIPWEVPTGSQIKIWTRAGEREPNFYPGINFFPVEPGTQYFLKDPGDYLKGPFKNLDGQGGCASSVGHRDPEKKASVR